MKELVDAKDVVESKNVVETPKASSELKDDISGKYDKYLEDNKSKSFEYKSGKDIDEVAEKKGGSYKEIKANMDERGETGQNKFEVHHMPADSVNGIDSKGDGPAIKMEKEDHMQTASYGRSKDADAYRAQQDTLVKNGKFDEAVQMDVDDIKGKFGNKYDAGISEMLDYAKKYN